MRKAVRVESNRKPSLLWYTPDPELATPSTDPASFTETAQKKKKGYDLRM